MRCGPLTADAVLEAIKKVAVWSGQKPVVMLGGDLEVAAVSERYDEFATICRVSLPAPEIVRTLGNKALFQAFAERDGFPVPRAVTFKDPADLPALRTLGMPVVIKPVDKALVLAGLVDRALRAKNFEEAAAAATRMVAHAGPVLIQEWIDGADSDIVFCLFNCDANSRCVQAFVGRKVVCDPPDVGSTAVCIAAPEVERELLSITTRLIDRVKYQGMGSLEFKRCRNTGRYLIVEPTVGRTDWQEEIATLCGVNIPLTAYRTELNLAQSESVGNQRSIAWRSSVGFRIPRGILPRGTRIYDGYFRVSDPLPGLYYYVVDAFLVRALRRTKRLLLSTSRSKAFTK
jgi:D-aspartate ligase